MGRPRPITACDCETDPFLNGRVPKPFIWGFYDGKNFRTFNTTEDFISFIVTQRVICYAHNGGKFDFMFLLPYAIQHSESGEVKTQIINGRIVSIKIGECEFVDSYAAVPESLKKIKKLDIEYWKLEAECREQYRDEIITYLRGDCVYLHELMIAYRQAAGTQKTIASNALKFAKSLGLKPGTTNFSFDSDFRPFYFGGRTQDFQSGTFRDISVVDLISSYPFAMMQDHPSGADRHYRSTLATMTTEEISRAFIRLHCNAKGCFPIRSGGSEGLTFPHATREYHVTGWEYLAAKELGLISEEKIIQVRCCEGVINFSSYVDHWFKYKTSHPKKVFPIEYTIGKIMMNSLYGKMAQNPTKYFDYKIVQPGAKLPCKEPIEDENENCKICGFHAMEHGWKLYVQFEGQTFFRRESLWKYKFRYGTEWEAKPLYKNVATGASITGFARANLLRAIHTVGIDKVLYCDTDSLVLLPGARTDKLPMQGRLGDWEKEIELAPVIHIAGKKLYGIDLGNGKPCRCNDPQEPCERHKVVTKGGRLTFAQMGKIAAGETISYAPAAPTFSIAHGKIEFPPRRFKRTSRS